MKTKAITVVGTIYSLITILYYLIAWIFAKSLDMTMSSRVGFLNTVDLIFLVLLFLSQGFKIALMFVVKRRFGLILSLSVLLSGLYSSWFGLFLTSILLSGALFVAFIKWIIDLFRRKWNVRPIINVVIPFIVVGIFFGYAYIISLYVVYEKVEIYPNIDNTYVIESDTGYNIHNEPVTEYVNLRENKTVNMGFVYLTAKEADSFSYFPNDIHAGEKPVVVEWIDNDTFVIDGTSYDIFDFIK